MFRMSFDRNVAENFEEQFSMRTWVLACVHSLYPCVRILDSCIHRLSSFVCVCVI